MHPKSTANVLKSALLSVLRQTTPQIEESFVDQQHPDALRNILGDVLVASNHQWKEETLQMIDSIWKEEAAARTKVPVEHLQNIGQVHGSKVCLWQGDITQLQSEHLAIVNAANDQGIGCFVPNHRCIDNVIHRQAGPRLRQECKVLMEERGSDLSTGTIPIVTSGYHLPSAYVIHITGPQVANRGIASPSERANLVKTYELVLDGASNTKGVSSIAIPCISTGLFGFPQTEAAQIAISTTMKWLEEHPSCLDRVIFNVFTQDDYNLYQEELEKSIKSNGGTGLNKGVEKLRDRSISLAKQWFDGADAVLVCAGAGMSVKEGEMVYTNPKDFAKAYPWFTKWGYKTCYETMGLEGDSRVPRNAKWALYAKHMDNMRWSFTPNDGYTELLNLVGDKDYFVLTSNVDACFERAGFDPKKVYTPQGEWTYVQCKAPCQPDSVFESRPYIDQILPHIDNEGYIPKELVPKCPRCGGEMFGNVRGGNWFLHHKYQESNARIKSWMQKQLDQRKNVVVIEIGAGFNTPTVTRFPVESFVRELGPNGRLVRINPSEPEIPDDLNAIALPEGWTALHDLGHSEGVVAANISEVESEIHRAMGDMDLVVPKQIVNEYRRYLGHFDWRRFLNQLRDNN